MNKTENRRKFRQLRFPPEQIKRWELLAKQKGVTVEELVKNAIERQHGTDLETVEERLKQAAVIMHQYENLMSGQ